MTTRPSRLLGTLVAALALALAGCGGDGDDATTDTDETGDVAEDEQALAELDETVDDAEGLVEDLADLEGTAELDLAGTTTSFASQGQYGCVVLEDGGSDGAIEFEGAAEDGSEFSLGWAGDSPDSATANLVTADGSEFTSPFTDVEFDVSITSPTSAEVSGVLVSLDDGSSNEFTATVTCG